jgi:hypothetical protein
MALGTHADLIERLAHTARTACRSVDNNAESVLHVSDRGLLLDWLMRWNPDTTRSVRKYIAGRAANEARRLAKLRRRAKDASVKRTMDAE